MNSIFIVLPILAILMFDLGLTLKPADFVRIFKYPRAMIAGLAGQLILLPLLALAIGTAFNLPAACFIGLMLIACCPGGSSSNVFSMVAKGDVALSVSLTACSSIITLFTLPIIMGFTTKALGEEVGITLPVWNLLKQNFFTTLLPIILGLLLRHFRENAALKLDKVLSKFALPAIILLATIFFIQNKEAFSVDSIGLASASLMIGAAVFAGLMSIALRLSKQQRRTIVIEVGMQNAAQAIAVATSPFVFNNAQIAVPAIIYALIMNIVLLAYLGIVRLKK